MTKTFEEIKREAIDRQMVVEFEGKKYYMTDDAYADNYQNDPAIFADAVTGEVDEYGDLVNYKIRWEYIEAENFEDCTDWENPVEVTEQ